MNRDDAVNLLREIGKVWTGKLPIEGLSIDGSTNNAELKIILPSDLFQSFLGVVQPIIDNHDFEFTEIGGSLIIYGPVENNRR